MLMPETWVDGHNEHLHDVLQDFFEHRGWSCWVDGHSGWFAQCLDALDGAMQIGVAFQCTKNESAPPSRG